jgi:hypothetical protein
VPSTNGTTDGTKIAFLEGTKRLKVSPRVLKTESSVAQIRLAWPGLEHSQETGWGECEDAGPRIFGRIIVEALLALLAAVGHFFGKGGL